MVQHQRSRAAAIAADPRGQTWKAGLAAAQQVPRELVQVQLQAPDLEQRFERGTRKKKQPRDKGPRNVDNS